MCVFIFRYLSNSRNTRTDRDILILTVVNHVCTKYHQIFSGLLSLASETKYMYKDIYNITNIY